MSLWKAAPKLLSMLLLASASATDFGRWYPYPEAIRLAKQEGRVLMVYFWQHGCAFCDQMNTFVLSDPQVSALLERCFVVASVDSRSPEGSTLAQRFRALGTPTFLFLADLGGSPEELGRLFGSRTRAQFLRDLQGILRKGGVSCG